MLKTSSCQAPPPRSSGRIDGQCGFTLLELLVVMALLGIVSLTAMPAWQALMARQAMSSTAESLLGSLLYARNQAVTHDQPVRVCPLGSEQACGSHWSAGWQLMLGSDDGTFRVIDTRRLDPAFTLETAGSDDTGVMEFTPQGDLAEAFGGFRLAREQRVAHVCLTLSGQARIRAESCSA